MIASLFSGIGGLELGLEQAGLGETVLQVERDPYCRAVLARHWPDVRRLGDVRLVTGADVPLDSLLCGGFPCQDVSSAGLRRGLGTADAPTPRSGLWFEFHRIIGEARPTLVVIENVASGAGRWLPRVRRDLGASGYDSVPVVIGTDQMGAKHRRDRIFVVASRDGGVVEQVGRLAADPHRQGQLQSAGREYAVRRRSGDRAAWDAADERNAGAPDIQPWRGLAPEPALVRAVHGVPGWLDAAQRAAGWTPARVSAARIRALGNCVVPAQARAIGLLIRAAVAA